MRTVKVKVKQIPTFVVTLLAGSALIALFLAGCGSRSGTLYALPTPLQRSEALWHSRRVSSYRYTLKISAFIGPPATGPVRIEVRNGQAVSLTPADPSIPIDPAAFTSYNTIDKLFAVIEKAESRPADSIIADYDPTIGAPTNVFIDPSRNVADDEFGFTVTDFVAL